MRYFIFLILCGLVGQTAQAQKAFEGSLFFNIQMKGQQAAVLAENEPNKKMTMHIKDGDYVVHLSGGRVPKTFLFIADSNYEYSIDGLNERAYRFSPHTDLNQEKGKEVVPTAVATGRTDTIKGLPCAEYKMVKDKTTFYYYVSDRVRVDLSSFPENCVAKPSFLIKGLDGRIPLKSVRKMPGLIVATTITKMARKDLQKEQFLIPPFFDIKNRDYRY
ncbi:MAG: hypothetical protein AAF206_26490 [Bacteroidota bacterium]